jgi:clan AA aspartic protease (TIGR02281 family)
MYKWVDEKGNVHFTDDVSTIPEKFRQDIEEREAPKETAAPKMREKPTSSPTLQISEPEGMEVILWRRGELWMAEVVLNGRVRQNFVVDTGASFTLISKEAAKELGLTIDENTPFIPIASVSSIILTPLMTLRSVRVGKAEVENVDVLIYSMPSGQDGLLGNSFLNRFKVVLDSVQGKMTLFQLEGSPSSDRPGGYGRDYWVGRFRFYNRYLSESKKLKAEYEKRGARSELNRVNNAIRYFENQLSELERKASSVGVPRNWRD